MVRKGDPSAENRAWRVSRFTEDYFRGAFSKFAKAVKNIEKNGAGPLSTTVENKIREQEDRYEDVYARHAKKHGIKIDEYKRQLQKRVEEIVAESHFFQRVTVDALADLLGGSGRVKSQVETETRGGGVTHGAGVRRSNENALFGYPMDGKPENRPICGYMSRDKNGRLNSTDMSGYGPIIIKYKRASVINRTTVTFGDSFNGSGLLSGSRSRFVPTPASHPHFTSVFAGSFSKPEKGDNKNEWDPLTDLKPSDKPKSGSSDPYYEAQFHGGVGINDIESIHIKRSDLTKYPALQGIIDTFKKNNPHSGITIKYDS